MELSIRDRRYSEGSGGELKQSWYSNAVTGVLTRSLPRPVLERPDERTQASDFFGNLSKFVDNEP